MVYLTMYEETWFWWPSFVSLPRASDRSHFGVPNFNPSMVRSISSFQIRLLWYHHHTVVVGTYQMG